MGRSKLNSNKTPSILSIVAVLGSTWPVNRGAPLQLPREVPIWGLP